MKIYQIIDGNGEKVTYFKEKPVKMLMSNEYDGYDYTDGFLFPIPLKPLQIAEITVCADGTWSYEIEREEGWYMANKKPDFGRGIVQYKGGKWFDIDGAPLVISLEPYTISPTRIPDECII